ncbi:MAG: hypothetical protein PHQ75_14705 [Thermoguttaceae bacterium]|nr:hypothetical protein [Thermoguttaceae bacterium]
MKRLFDRTQLNILPLASRVTKLDFARLEVDPDTYPVSLSPEAMADIRQTADDLRRARNENASAMLTIGAHAIKNGLATVIARLIQGKWITHLATNGAGFIHDWEFAYQGQTGEDVERYVNEGQFGIWQETGFNLNLALNCGAYRAYGYGQSIAKLIADDGILIPDASEIHASLDVMKSQLENAFGFRQGTSTLELIHCILHFGLPAGKYKVKHRFPQYSLCCAALKADIPVTCHPMFGHDIIYTHPMCCGSAIGLTAEHDFLSFADSVSNLNRGVYLSVGSAVMSPMIFEKSLSMARNVAATQNRKIDDFAIHVVDLAPSRWDWSSDGEPPVDNPAYYLRFCKTFSRMGGKMSYCSADNRSWFVALLHELEK